MQFNNFLHKFRSTVAYKILGCLAYVFVPFVIYVYRCMVGPTGFGAIGCMVLYFGSCIVGGMAFFIITTIALFCALGKPKTKPNIVTDIGYGIYLLTVIIVLMHLLIYVPLQQQSDKIAAVNFEQDKILIQKIVDEINIENERLGYPYFYQNSTKYEFLDHFFNNIEGIKYTEPNKFITDKRDFKFDCFLSETNEINEKVVNQCNIFITYKNGLLKTRLLESVSTNHFYKDADKKHLLYEFTK